MFHPLNLKQESWTPFYNSNEVSKILQVDNNRILLGQFHKVILFNIELNARSFELRLLYDKLPIVDICGRINDILCLDDGLFACGLVIGLQFV